MSDRTDVVEVVVSVEVEGFSEIVRRLRDAGLDVGEEMPALGTVIGYATGGAISDLRRVPGVSALEVARHVQLPPPDSDIQ